MVRKRETEAPSSSLEILKCSFPGYATCASARQIGSDFRFRIAEPHLIILLRIIFKAELVRSLTTFYTSLPLYTSTMAAASDKARFYLEQYVPELRSYEAKGIFTRDEIASITSKRSNFEHILNARGSTPADYARYATYELNLDALRKKRCKRLGVKAKNAFNGQRTIFFVLDRATKKFPGDMSLWMQYINFCKKEKANKKLANVFTRVLRLHPRSYGLWVLAAKHYAETQGDMGTARSYMQRGLRFCKDEKSLYMEYAKLEMVYLAKIAARRRILGLDEKREEKIHEDEDMIALPTITAADFEVEGDTKGVEEVDKDLLQRLANAPAFTGGIPVAIFDSAMSQVKHKPEAAEEFFNMVAEFDQVPSTPKILNHILDWLRSNAAASPETIICEAMHELFGVQSQSVNFPAALGRVLARVKAGSSKVPEKTRPVLAEKAVLVLIPLLREADDTDEDIIKVLESSIKQYLRTTAEVVRKPGGMPTGPAAIIAKLEGQGRAQDAEILRRISAEAGLG